MTRPIRRLQAVEAIAAPVLGAAVHYVRSGSDAISELGPDNLADHHARFGVRPSCRGAAGRDLLDRLTAAELTGRGGGHFRVATKWQRVQSASWHRGGLRDPGPVVIANGAEGEPLSRKDSALLELRPHLVLDGLACAAETLGASRSVLWLDGDAHAARGAVTRALAERAAHAPDLPVPEVLVSEHTYLSGESSAVVQGVSGGPSRPGFARVPAAQRGVDGLPTLVQNVETLARVGLLARDADPDTVLLTVAARDHLVVVECSERASLAAVVADTVGGPPPQALLLGGYGGSWVPWSQAVQLSASEREVRELGLSLGAGVVMPVAAGECGLTHTAEIAEYLADQTARQCGPCQFGLPAIAQSMRLLADARFGRADSRRLDRFLTEVAGRGACHHPDGAVRLVRTALVTFAADVQAHRRNHCLAEEIR